MHKNTTLIKKQQMFSDLVLVFASQAVPDTEPLLNTSTPLQQDKSTFKPLSVAFVVWLSKAMIAVNFSFILNTFFFPSHPHKTDSPLSGNIRPIQIKLLT